MNNLFRFVCFIVKMMHSVHSQTISVIGVRFHIWLKSDEGLMETASCGVCQLASQTSSCKPCARPWHLRRLSLVARVPLAHFFCLPFAKLLCMVLDTSLHMQCVHGIPSMSVFTQTHNVLYILLHIHNVHGMIDASQRARNFACEARSINICA